MSPVFDCSTPQGRAEGVQKATEAVRSGRLVVLPTDTLYGIGCDAFAADAVADLLAAKGRGREMPPPVLVPDARTVEGLATDIPAYARALIEQFWPGPLTLVLRAHPTLHWDLGDTNGTVAVRMPDDELALEVLSAIGPMAVSSANRTGYPAAKDVLDAATQLGAAVQVYLDAGPVRGGLASTIVDCTGEEPDVLREGALGRDAVEEVVARVRESEAEWARRRSPDETAEPLFDPRGEPIEPQQSDEPGEPGEAPEAPEAPEVSESPMDADAEPLEFTDSPSAKETHRDE